MPFLFDKDNNKYKTVYKILGIKVTISKPKKQIQDLLKENSRILEERNRNIKLYKDLKSKYNSLKDRYNSLKEYSNRINGISSQIESFKEYFLKNNMPEKIERLKRNLDEQSLDCLDNLLKKILHLPDRTYRNLYRTNLSELAKYFETPEEKMGIEVCHNNIQKWKEQFPLCEDTYDEEVLYKHHGLKEANSKLLEYIKDKDFIDGGAYIGDSALVLFQYSPNKIYSFEMSPNNCKKFSKTMEINNISDDSYELVPYGISDRECEFFIDDSGLNNTSLNNTGNTLVRVTDLDSYVFANNLNVGFIKTDLEGFGLKALNGMEKTIQNYRPVLSMAIYHSPEEFFEVKPRLEEITKDLNYKICIEKHFPVFHLISGTVLFAYPRELDE